MKKLSISLVALGISSLGLAQNSFPEFHQFNLKEFSSPSSNDEYLNEVQNELTPKHVKYLENLVSDLDVDQLKKSEGYKNYEFNVIIRSDLGRIVASYDDQGNIKWTEEWFKNIALPNKVSVAIVKEYPEWSVIKNKYLLLYMKDERPRKLFKVQIRKDNQKKWLKIDSEGRIS